MHIEVGIIDAARVAAANAVALTVVASQLPALFRRPDRLVGTAATTVAFSVLMQVWHLPVGPSELHLIGATTVYLLFGLAPTIVGFALGLLLQAVLFEPQDLVHLGVNALSLMVPLLALHALFGKRIQLSRWTERFTLGRALKLDATYYAGVVSMVGFWLAISNDAFAAGDFARWAAAYLPVFGAEALLTLAMVRIIAALPRESSLRRWTRRASPAAA